MKFYNTTKLALILAQQALIEGMKAGNSQNPDTQPFSGNDFGVVANELKELSKLPDYITAKESHKSTDNIVVSTHSVREFICKCDYYPAHTAEYSVKSEIVSSSIYSDYKSFCYDNAYPFLSHVLFSDALFNLGFSKKRKTDGVIYTIFSKITK